MSRHLYLPTPTYERRRWRVEWRKLRSDHGVCDFENRLITINSSDPIELQQSTLRHEVLHATRGDEEEHVLMGEYGLGELAKLIQRHWPED